MSDVILKATYETLYMVIGSTFFAVVLGFIPAINILLNKLVCKKYVIINVIIKKNILFIIRLSPPSLIKSC